MERSFYLHDIYECFLGMVFSNKTKTQAESKAEDCEPKDRQNRKFYVSFNQPKDKETKKAAM